MMEVTRMSEPETRMRYECLEAGCGWSTEVGSEKELLEVVGAHMADAHDTFELEDVIIDAAVPVAHVVSKVTHRMLVADSDSVARRPAAFESDRRAARQRALDVVAVRQVRVAKRGAGASPERRERDGRVERVTGDVSIEGQLMPLAYVRLTKVTCLSPPGSVVTVCR